MKEDSDAEDLACLNHLIIDDSLEPRHEPLFPNDHKKKELENIYFCISLTKNVHFERHNLARRF